MNGDPVTITSSTHDLLTSPDHIRLEREAVGVDIAPHRTVFVTTRGGEIAFASTPLSSFFRTAAAGEWFDHPDGSELQFLGEYTVKGRDDGTVDLTLMSPREVACTDGECLESTHLVSVIFDEPEHLAWKRSNDSAEVQVVRTGDEPWHVYTNIWDRESHTPETLIDVARIISEATLIAAGLNPETAGA